MAKSSVPLEKLLRSTKSELATQVLDLKSQIEQLESDHIKTLGSARPRNRTAPPPKHIVDTIEHLSDAFVT